MNASRMGMARPKFSCQRCSFAVVVSVLILMGMTSAAWAGERQTFKVTEVDRQVLSEHTLSPPDVPGHTLVLRVQRQVIKAPTNPEYDGADVLIYVSVERVQGIGTSRGVTVDTLKNGDKIFWNFQSKSKKIEKEGGSWELTFEGAGEIVGGTGKYKNAKGHETFSGTVTPDSSIVNTEITWEY